jgi:hypothetical protein
MNSISPPRSRRSSKPVLKATIAGLLCLLVAAIPGTLFYLLWSWCLAQVPMAFAWAGLVKIGITLVMVLLGGGATIALTILCGSLAVAIAAAILDGLPR